ncbi:hypothetical protein AB4254_08190 [Vibrio breoganii]
MTKEVTDKDIIGAIGNPLLMYLGFTQTDPKPKATNPKAQKTINEKAS